MVNLEEKSSQKSKKRIFYLDALRAMAILTVIMFHVQTSTHSLVWSSQYFHTYGWFVSDFMGVSSRIGVCLFLMLAGALSLGRSWNIKIFLGRRLPRIVTPFLFWGFVLATSITLFLWFCPWSNTFLSHFALEKFSALDTHSLFSYLSFLFSYYMSDAFTSSPYWFFWMILGTYFIMPIFDKWVANSNLRELEYFLFFWLITCIFDFTLGIPFPIKLTYFVSPIGLVVLGYYLRYTDRKILNNPYFALFLVVISCVLEVFISYHLSAPRSFYLFDRYSILPTIEVIGVFLLFKNAGKFNININFFNNPKGIFRKSISSLAKYSYGLYLFHKFVLVFIFEAFKHFKNIMAHATLTILLVLVLTVLVSWLVIDLLNRIPNMGKFIGAK